MKKTIYLIPIFYLVNAVLLLVCCTSSNSYDRIDQPVFFEVFVAGQEDITGYNDEAYARFREQNVVVTGSGAIVVIVQGRNKSDWDDHKEQYTGDHYEQYIIYSDDEGYTWSKPRGISRMADDPSVIQIFGSGEGIQLQKNELKGRLIVPGGDFQKPYKRVFAWISDDHGETWRVSQPVPNPQNRITPSENAIVELDFSMEL